MATEIKKTDAEGARLTPEQYEVLRRQGTERAFTGKYWNNHDDGIRRCAGRGAELFDSTRSSTRPGWPSSRSRSSARRSRFGATARTE
jgi:peptide-methionine (R)-S-oxide reductase